MRIMSVVGARPNFMKMDPVIRNIKMYSDDFDHVLIHTGQHYDPKMSQIFFDELGMPFPDINLEVGSGTHAFQTAEIMKRFESVLLDYRPDWLIVPGDVNSTLACALVASKMGVPVAHLESGLRSFDRSMPEEINRILTDQLSDMLLIPSLDAKDNLLRENIPEDKIYFVGNAMIDTLIRLLPLAQQRTDYLLNKYNFSKDYILCTLHRPSNVDNKNSFYEILKSLIFLSKKYHIVFPVHPRTKMAVSESGFEFDKKYFHFLDPLGYLDFLSLQSDASLVITDSGGVQEETTYLNVPCLTVRENTERPVTIFEGTNSLVSAKSSQISSFAMDKIKGINVSRSIPTLWDGKTGERIVNIFREMCLCE